MDSSLLETHAPGSESPLRFHLPLELYLSVAESHNMGAVCFGYMIAHLKVALLVCLTRRPLPGPAKYHLWNPRCRRYETVSCRIYPRRDISPVELKPELAKGGVSTTSGGG